MFIHICLFSYPTIWGPQPIAKLVELNPMNYSYLRIINHSEIGGISIYIPQRTIPMGMTQDPIDGAT